MLPLSARTVPAIRLNSELLPAPFGPIMPRHSPALHRKGYRIRDDDPAIALAQVANFRVWMPVPPLPSTQPGQRRQRGIQRDVRRGAVVR